MNTNKNEQITVLLDQYIKQSLTQSEFKELCRLLNQCSDQEFHTLIQDYLALESFELPTEFIQNRVTSLHKPITAALNRDNSLHKPLKSSFKLKRLWSFTAAAAILLLGIFGYRHFNSVAPLKPFDQQAVNDVLPGSNKASIIIDGKVYALQSDQAGLRIGADKIMYSNGEQMLADVSHNKSIKVVTPRAGHYHLQLADGTKVWLNAGSTLSYLPNYGKQNRTVEVQGEAYFEVQKNKNLPFIVKSKNQEIEVLGTEFNIQAYLDEPLTKTTLKGGSLRVRTLAGSHLLKPNEQTIFNQATMGIQQQSVDADAVIGWKNGIIDLHGMSLEECMRLLARWYDVDIIYENKIPAIELGGRISSGLKLSTFLTFLSSNFNIHAELSSNKKLYVKYEEPK